MNELREGIAQIAAAATDAERAAALLACPLSLLMTCEFTIRNRMQVAGFHEGIRYLETELAALRGFRNETGLPPGGMDVAVVRGRLGRISRGEDPSGQGEA